MGGFNYVPIPCLYILSGKCTLIDAPYFTMENFTYQGVSAATQWVNLTQMLIEYNVN